MIKHAFIAVKDHAIQVTLPTDTGTFPWGHEGLPADQVGALIAAMEWVEEKNCTSYEIHDYRYQGGSK